MPARGKRSILLHRGVKLLLLLRRHAQQGSPAIQFLGIHALEPAEFVQRALLRLGRECAEAGVILEFALLIGRREVPVLLHPHLEAGPVLGWTACAILGKQCDATSGYWGRPDPYCRRPRPLPGRRRRRISRLLRTQPGRRGA